MSRPWMPMYWGDYFRDTRHLKKQQHASYLLLIAHYWETGSLPDDDEQLATIALSTSEEWKTEKPILQRFFYDGWKHKRIEAELIRHAEKVAKAREHGKKGGQMAAMNREKFRYNSGRYSGR